jgi:hypothetical protein
MICQYQIPPRPGFTNWEKIFGDLVLVSGGEKETLGEIQEIKDKTIVTISDQNSRLSTK